MGRILLHVVVGSLGDVTVHGILLCIYFIIGMFLFCILLIFWFNIKLPVLAVVEFPLPLLL